VIAGSAVGLGTLPHLALVDIIDPTERVTCSPDSCEQRPPSASAASPRERLTIYSARELIGLPPPLQIVEGIVWADCITVLAGESGSGKTYVELDLAAAIADGAPWHGRYVHQGSVLYLSYESNALGLRLRAVREVTGRSLDHLYVVPAHDPLSPRVTREGEMPSLGLVMVLETIDAIVTDLAATGRPPIVLVIIDTVRASLSGSEDSSENVSAYLRAVRRVLARMPGAACILVHHAGWQDGETRRQRERGSSAWRGNVDVTLYLEAGEYDTKTGTARLTLRALKVRDAEPPAPLHLIRRRVVLDEAGLDGKPVTSCVIERDHRTRADHDAERRDTIQAAERQIDIRILRAIHDFPEAARSRDGIRAVVGLGAPVVQKAILRTVERRWVIAPERQRQPYRLTPIAHEVLSETNSDQSQTGTESVGAVNEID
jgi:hypothetical protein